MNGSNVTYVADIWIKRRYKLVNNSSPDVKYWKKKEKKIAIGAGNRISYLKIKKIIDE